jgi:hypothetical protein
MLYNPPDTNSSLLRRFNLHYHSLHDNRKYCGSVRRELDTVRDYYGHRDPT